MVFCYCSEEINFSAYSVFSIDDRYAENNDFKRHYNFSAPVMFHPKVGHSLDLRCIPACVGQGGRKSPSISFFYKYFAPLEQAPISRFGQL